LQYLIQASKDLRDIPQSTIRFVLIAQKVIFHVVLFMVSRYAKSCIVLSENEGM